MTDVSGLGKNRKNEILIMQDLRGLSDFKDACLPYHTCTQRRCILILAFSGTLFERDLLKFA